MKQRAHAWVALRALKLLDDSKKAPKLVELLSYYLSDIWEGAWLPDSLIVDMRYGHVFKMESDARLIGSKTKDERAKVPYPELKKRLKGKRLCLEHIENSKEFNKHYWSVEGHLPNRVISLGHVVGDMLKMADYPVAFYAKEEKPEEYMGNLTEQNVKDLSLSPNFSARQIALSFFMLSHYVCDCHMPLHCDLRDFKTEKAGRRLPAKLHPSIEKKWETYLPPKEILSLGKQTELSVGKIVKMLPQDSVIALDSDPQFALSKKIPLIPNDEWLEMVNVARVSFVLAREWISSPYKDVNELIQDKGEAEFKRVTNQIFHDAVQDIALVWYRSWTRYLK